uniref:Elongation factor 1-beta-like isoform 1 n=1 Tax=Bemisia tabaci TaxID=7038 RepID=A0A7S5LK90_BEMTA|nr:elongation factor 1-beta-like isoform 1 [Bemisia tabaci]
MTPVDLKSPAGVKELDTFLADRSYIEGKVFMNFCIRSTPERILTQKDHMSCILPQEHMINCD